ncbi:EutN/CcmL family microcompartment protein [bacterium]|nr:EutN/CcmL family microcompartment protein [bacterium]
MIFAKVVGSVVCTQKDRNLAGLKLMLCREADHAGKLLDAYHVAVDAVQSGPGDFVLLSYGSSARMTEMTRNAPVDAVILSIVDDVQVTEKAQKPQSGGKHAAR